MITVPLHKNHQAGIRLVFSTEDRKELTAHLETLDALQVRRPSGLPVEPPVMWGAAFRGASGAEYRVRFLTSPTHVEYELAQLKENYGRYYGELLSVAYCSRE